MGIYLDGSVCTKMVFLFWLYFVLKWLFFFHYNQNKLHPHQNVNHLCRTCKKNINIKIWSNAIIEMVDFFISLFWYLRFVGKKKVEINCCMDRSFFDYLFFFFSVEQGFRLSAGLTRSVFPTEELQSQQTTCRSSDFYQWSCGWKA